MTLLAFIGLEFVSIELDDPYGDDPNDFDILGMAKVAFDDIFICIYDADGKERAMTLKKCLNEVEETFTMDDDDEDSANNSELFKSTTSHGSSNLLDNIEGNGDIHDSAGGDQNNINGRGQHSRDISEVGDSKSIFMQESKEQLSRRNFTYSARNSAPSTHTIPEHESDDHNPNQATRGPEPNETTRLIDFP